MRFEIVSTLSGEWQLWVNIWEGTAKKWNEINDIIRFAKSLNIIADTPIDHWITELDDRQAKSEQWQQENIE